MYIARSVYSSIAIYVLLHIVAGGLVRQYRIGKIAQLRKFSLRFSAPDVRIGVDGARERRAAP